MNKARSSASKIYSRILTYTLLGGIFFCLLVPTLHARHIESEEQHSTTGDTATVNEWNRIASALIEKGQYREADSLIERAAASADSLNYREGQAEALVNRGDYYLSVGRYDSAQSVLRRGYERYKDLPMESKYGNLLATAYRFNGELSKAMELYTKALEEAKEQGKTSRTAQVEENLAVVYQKMGDLGKAMEHHHRSLEQLEAIGDSSSMATVLNNIGNLGQSMKHYEQAEQHLLEAIEISKKIGQDVTLNNSYLNLGNVYKETDQPDKAREYYNKALALGRKMGRKIISIKVKYNIGDLHLKQSNPDSARYYYGQTLKLSKESNLIPGYFYGNFGLGRTAAATRDYAQAEQHLSRALEVARKIENPGLQRMALEKLYQTMEEGGSYRKAFKYLEEYKTIDDSLTTARQQQEIARYRTQFDLRQEEQKNRLLETELAAQRQTLLIGGIGLFLIVLISIALFWMYRKKQYAYEQLEELNRKITDQKEELEELNDTKNKLLSVLAHDLRNPISNIQQVASLLKQDILSKEDVQEIAEHTENQLQHSLNTLENLLTWARNQTTGIEIDLTHLKLKDNIQQIEKSLEPQANDKNVEVINRVDRDLEIKADENMMEIILMNLATNAIKYVDEGDQITFDATRENGKVIIEVKDTGPGIPKEQRQELFQPFGKSTKGTKDERGVGLGLSLCKEFTEKLGGRIWFESEEGEGTSFYVELPSKN